MVVEIKIPIFLDMLWLMTTVMPTMMTLESLEVVSETTKLKEKELQSNLNVHEKSTELELFN